MKDCTLEALKWYTTKLYRNCSTELALVGIEGHERHGLYYCLFFLLQQQPAGSLLRAKDHHVFEKRPKHPLPQSLVTRPQLDEVHCIAQEIGVWGRQQHAGTSTAGLWASGGKEGSVVGKVGTSNTIHRLG